MCREDPEEDLTFDFKLHTFEVEIQSLNEMNAGYNLAKPKYTRFIPRG